MVNRKSRSQPPRRDWRSRKEQILQTLEQVHQRPFAQKTAKKTLENISQMEDLQAPRQPLSLTV
jgi:hypothetical protein